MCLYVCMAGWMDRCISVCISVGMHARVCVCKDVSVGVWFLRGTIMK